MTKVIKNRAKNYIVRQKLQREDTMCHERVCCITMDLLQKHSMLIFFDLKTYRVIHLKTQRKTESKDKKRRKNQVLHDLEYHPYLQHHPCNKWLSSSHVRFHTQMQYRIPQQRSHKHTFFQNSHKHPKYANGDCKDESPLNIITPEKKFFHFFIKREITRISL